MSKKNRKGKKHNGNGKQIDPPKPTLQPPPLLALMQKDEKGETAERKRYNDTIDGPD